MEDLLNKFCETIILYITGKHKQGKTMIVKKHSENLQFVGDFSFPNNYRPWCIYFENMESILSVDKQDLLLSVGKNVEDFIKDSHNWILQLKDAIEIKNRIHLFLDRPQTLRIGLPVSLANLAKIAQGFQMKTSFVEVDLLCLNKSCLTNLRVQYVSEVILNLLSVSALYSEQKIFVTSKSSSECPEDYVRVLCGAVLNVKSNLKENLISADEYIRIRQNEMTLIAQHKYGVRVSTDEKWREFITHLGESSVAFELLQTKPSSSVKINFENLSAGSSKGAAFILYNCARLETIIRTYNDKVKVGIYPALPSLEDTDFSLLTHEDEWALVFSYIMGQPSLLDHCVEINEGKLEFRPHHICSFLSSLVRVFSQYYRKVRILTEPRKHLLPVMFARIHMLKILNETLKSCLKILNIKSVSQMYLSFFYFKISSYYTKQENRYINGLET